jgi:hypothetical protein
MWRTLVLVAAVVATGCAGASAGPDPSVSGAPSSASITVGRVTGSSIAPLSSIDEAVLAAVDGFGRSTISVNDPPDPTHPDLARFRTGEVLTRAVEVVAHNRELGIAYRLPSGSSYTHSASVLQVSDVRAIVRDCVVDSAQQVDLSDGHVLNDRVATKLFETRLVVADGSWKVAANELVDRWEGVGGCAVAASR